MPAKIPWTEREKYDSIMKPLRIKYGVPEAPAMSVTHSDLPAEYLDSEGKIVELQPQRRYDMFNKIWKTTKG